MLQREDCITVVCGFPRCGSSLTMQMLDAGGYLCVGKFPDYEGYQPWKDSWQLYPTFQGHAVKLLDMFLQVGFPSQPCPERFILLGRNPRQQARSTVKWARSQGIDTLGNREKDFEKQIRECTRTFLQMLRFRVPVLRLSFENMLNIPRICADRLVSFLGEPLDKDAMVACVKERAEASYPGLLELGLLTERHT